MLEFAICLTITLWPQCLGLNLDQTVMVKTLQSSYGVPGREQFTAAIDLAQTQFECCAINNNINYDMSLWRLQGFGQRDWAVPLTCCWLNNKNDPLSYLDPKPINMTMCQSVRAQDYEKGRYTEVGINLIYIANKNLAMVFIFHFFTLYICFRDA